MLFIVTHFSVTAIGFSLALYAIIRNKEAALALLTGVISLISMLVEFSGQYNYASVYSCLQCYYQPTVPRLYELLTVVHRDIALPRYDVYVYHWIFNI